MGCLVFTLKTQFVHTLSALSSSSIEKGKYIGLQEEGRKCEFCPDRAEAEVHFLFECT